MNVHSRVVPLFCENLQFTSGYCCRRNILLLSGLVLIVTREEIIEEFIYFATEPLLDISINHPEFRNKSDSLFLGEPIVIFTSDYTVSFI